jgi:serine/threonine protein kinase
MSDLAEASERMGYITWEKTAATCLGQGSFGSAYLGRRRARHGRYRKWDEGDVAVKVPLVPLSSQEDIQKFMTEVLIMFSAQHPAILPLFAWGYEAGDYLLVTEKMPTDLATIFQAQENGKAPPAWNATTRSITALGIAAGLCYLHEKRIVHRDLKPSNVLMDERCYPRVADFGLARLIPVADQMRMTVGIGTPLYMAPELQGSGSACYDTGVDVYAWALVFYQIATGKKPFYEHPNLTPTRMATLALKNTRPTIPDDVPEAQSEIMAACWDHDPAARWSLRNVIERTDDLMIEGCDPVEFAEYKSLVIGGLSK